MQTVDEAILAEEDDEGDPPPNVRDYELGAWFERRYGRRPSSRELEALRTRHARVRRRRILKWRRAGASDVVIVDRLVVEMLTSSEAMLGAALVTAAVAVLRESMWAYLRMSDAAGRGPATLTRWPHPRRTLLAASEYAASKLDNRPVPASAVTLPPDLTAALNSTDEEGLAGWRWLLASRCRSTGRALQRSTLDELAEAGQAAVTANPSAGLDRPEPGPPRSLQPLRLRNGGESGWERVKEAAADADAALSPQP